MLFQLNHKTTSHDKPLKAACSTEMPVNSQLPLDQTFSNNFSFLNHGVFHSACEAKQNAPDLGFGPFCTHGTQ